MIRMLCQHVQHVAGRENQIKARGENGSRGEGGKALGLGLGCRVTRRVTGYIGLYKYLEMLF